MLAPAKVNLVLRVGPRRADGFHDLVSLMVALDVGDELSVIGTARTSVEAPDLPGGDTLVTRALAILGERTGGAWGVTIGKRLPGGAGLGGGSADAGVALRMANALLDRPLASAELVALAAQVGSDVPFFASGASAAIVEGRGERVEPVRLAARVALVVAWPGFEAATPVVYAGYDRLVPRASLAGARDRALAATAALTAEALAPLLVNDLAAAAEETCPATASLRTRLSAAGALATGVCGSGSAAFGLFRDRGHAAPGLAAVADAPFAVVARTTTATMTPP